MKKEVKKEYSKVVKGKTITEKLRVREYSDMALYTSKKAWMTGRIWSYELEKLDRQLGKEQRKILLICDNCPSHQVVQLKNIELLFLMPGCTATLQIRLMTNLNLNWI